MAEPKRAAVQKPEGADTVAMEDIDPDFTAILYCPVCCTNVDVEESGKVELECDTCETKFTVMVDPKKVAVHSMFG